MAADAVPASRAPRVSHGVCPTQSESQSDEIPMCVRVVSGARAGRAACLPCSYMLTILCLRMNPAKYERDSDT